MHWSILVLFSLKSFYNVQNFNRWVSFSLRWPAKLRRSLATCRWGSRKLLSFICCRNLWWHGWGTGWWFSRYGISLFLLRLLVLYLFLLLFLFLLFNLTSLCLAEQSLDILCTTNTALGTRGISLKREEASRLDDVLLFNEWKLMDIETIAISSTLLLTRHICLCCTCVLISKLDTSVIMVSYCAHLRNGEE